MFNISPIRYNPRRGFTHPLVRLVKLLTNGVK